MNLYLVCDDDKLAPELMDLVRAYYPFVQEDPTGSPLIVNAHAHPHYMVTITCVGRRWQDEQEVSAESPLLVARHYK